MDQKYQARNAFGAPRWDVGALLRDAAACPVREYPAVYEAVVSHWGQ